MNACEAVADGRGHVSWTSLILIAFYFHHVYDVVWSDFRRTRGEESRWKKYEIIILKLSETPPAGRLACFSSNKTFKRATEKHLSETIF